MYWDRLHTNVTIDGSRFFIIVKATEGSSKVDVNFNNRFLSGTNMVLFVVLYHFWSNKSTAREQAYFFLKKGVHLKKRRLTTGSRY